MTAGAIRATWGPIGTVAGLLAIAVAVLPFWILPAIFPPKPIDLVVVETGQRIKERIKDRLAGRTETEQPKPTREQSESDRWYQLCSIAAVSLGVGAIGLGVVSFLRREPWRHSAAPAALGVAAIVAQYAVLALMVVLTLLLLFVILDHIGIF